MCERSLSDRADTLRRQKLKTETRLTFEVSREPRSDVSSGDALDQRRYPRVRRRLAKTIIIREMVSDTRLLSRDELPLRPYRRALCNPPPLFHSTGGAVRPMVVDAEIRILPCPAE